MYWVPSNIHMVSISWMYDLISLRAQTDHGFLELLQRTSKICDESNAFVTLVFNDRYTSTER